MAKKIQKCGVRRESGYLYYIDKEGDVSRAKMARGGKKGGKPEKVFKAGLKKESGYLYFLDKKGDVSRAAMARSGADVHTLTRSRRASPGPDVHGPGGGRP